MPPPRLLAYLTLHLEAQVGWTLHTGCPPFCANKAAGRLAGLVSTARTYTLPCAPSAGGWRPPFPASADPPFKS
ncbi:hypothetical protein LZ31DRAFT_218146 [Colletotrichum somersetense]|nr:hypothetical protein LZ31DRAFT_218146 [Colletotrichum somersetense]